MFNTKSSLKKDHIEELDTLIHEVEARGGILIYAHPFYEWLESNINSISYKLLKASITNIVPLGEDGRRFFELIATKRRGFYNEILVVYDKSEKMYHESNLKVKSYLELRHLGYTGQFLDGRCPVDDVLRDINKNS